MFLTGTILPVIMIILVNTVMPESPRWLVDKGADTEAKEILRQVYPPGKEKKNDFHFIYCLQFFLPLDYTKKAVFFSLTLINFPY